MDNLAIPHGLDRRLPPSRFSPAKSVEKSSGSVYPA
jgi:hypothetical protein